MELTPWGWVAGALGAMLIGLSKSGIPGLGILPVALFALILPARVSVGIVLPLLICGDVIAVAVFRRHAVWPCLWRMFPWAALGIVIGWRAMGIVNDVQVKLMIGSILLMLIAVHLWWRRKQTDQTASEGLTRIPLFTPIMGIMAGFTTMIANAAGPIMILYLLAMRLPKYEFIGTGAWYFLIMNCFKVPFSADLGLIHPLSLELNAKLAVFVVVGALIGRALVARINQKLFETLALTLSAAGAIKLLF